MKLKHKLTIEEAETILQNAQFEASERSKVNRMLTRGYAFRMFTGYVARAKERGEKLLPIPVSANIQREFGEL
jgi:hypothetical protein